MSQPIFHSPESGITQEGAWISEQLPTLSDEEIAAMKALGDMMISGDAAGADAFYHANRHLLDPEYAQDKEDK